MCVTVFLHSSCNGYQTYRLIRHTTTVHLKRGSTSSPNSPANRTPPHTTDNEGTRRLKQQENRKDYPTQQQMPDQKKVTSQPTNPTQTLVCRQKFRTGDKNTTAQKNKMEKSSSKQKEKEKGQKADKKKRQSTTEPITPEAPHSR